jgi:hypothetical protein
MLTISDTMAHRMEDGVPRITDTYEAPAAALELVTNLRGALAGVPHVREAFLVGRRRAIDGRAERRQLGVAAHVGGFWRSRKHMAAFESAVKPFFPPPETAPLGWSSFGNSRVADEIRAVGVSVNGDPLA